MSDKILACSTELIIPGTLVFNNTLRALRANEQIQ